MGSDGIPRIWDAETGESVAELFGPVGDYVAVAWASDGARIATAGTDGVARVWSIEGREEDFAIVAHDDAMTDISYSPDGDVFATAGHDGSIRLWDARTGEARLVVTDRAASVRSLAFSPNGRRLAAAEDLVRIYMLDVDELVDLATARLTRALSDDECRRYLHVESCPPSR